MSVDNYTKIPEGFAPRDYTMDPKTEDVIRGTGLQQGMVVLIEHHSMREDPSRDFGDDTWARARLDVNNCWCRVTDLETRDDISTFVGVYSDGVKRSRTYNQSHYWIVKL